MERLPGVPDPRAARPGRSRTSSSAAPRTAAPTAQVLEALADARAVSIGPSNPVISIGPILARGRDARRRCATAAAPVVAVSPLVGGRSLKGPTEALPGLGGPAARRATASPAYYDGLLDGLVADERSDALPTLETDVADAATPPAAAASPREALDFALALGCGRA